MPSIKDLKKRIGSVKNTQQTTRAMKMVSAAKLRRAQDAIYHNRPYAKRLRDLIQTVAGLSSGNVELSFLKRERELKEGEKKRAMLVVVTSDRGLCGAFNSGAIKRAQRWVVENQANYESIELMFVGRKGYEFLRTKNFGKIGRHFSEVTGKPTYAHATKIAEELIGAYVSGRADEVYFVFNEFVNVVTQRPTVEKFLPLESAQSNAEAGLSYCIVKPDYGTVLQELMEKNFGVQVFRVLLEAQAGEHGARMSAMENATKNAGEMIRKLSLQYNKQRQAGITKELLEIISGSESQKS
jgi:F-type H+-transporting ATPase subunit gamma